MSVVETENVVLEQVHSVADKVVDKIFEQVLTNLKIKMGPLELNGRTLMVAMRYAMELVELTELKGEAQKQLVIRLLQRLVKDAPLSVKKEELCMKLINAGIVGQTIDLIIDATKGNLQVNNIVQTVTTAMMSTRCCGLF